MLPTETLTPPTSKVTTDRLRLAVIIAVSDGHSIPVAAERAGVHRSTAEAILGLAGHPNVSRLTASPDRLALAVSPAPPPPPSKGTRMRQPAECTLDGCTRKPKSLGLCQTHYQQARRAAA